MMSRTVIALACAIAFAGCAPRGRIKGPEEGRMVGSDRAGSETYEALIDDATRELFEQTTAVAVNNPGGAMKVAFAGVINQSAESLRDFHAAINQSVETIVFRSRLFNLINQLYVRTALDEINVSSPEKLFLATYRKQFLDQLAAEGQVPDFLVFATFTSQTTRAERLKERVYNMSLDMVDARSGSTIAKVTKQVTKEYR